MAVYVSHDLAVVSQLVTDVAVMYSGRVIEIGTTQDVLGNPVHPYARGLVDAGPAIGTVMGSERAPRPHSMKVSSEAAARA